MIKQITSRISPLLVLAALSVVAADIHAYVMPENFREWWGYGAFFLALVVFQNLYAVLLVAAPRRPVFALGVVANLAMVSIWTLTRTVGIPFFGPGAGEVEAFSTLDIVAQSIELVLVLALAGLALGLPLLDRARESVSAAAGAH